MVRWRAAAVADSDGNILDVEEWDGWHDTNAVCSRMDIIAHEALTRRLRGYWKISRLKPLIHGDENLPDAEWPLPSNEALEYLDKAAILLSKRGVDAAAETLIEGLSTFSKPLTNYVHHMLQLKAGSLNGSVFSYLKQDLRETELG